MKKRLAFLLFSSVLVISAGSPIIARGQDANTGGSNSRVTNSGTTTNGVKPMVDDAGDFGPDTRSDGGIAAPNANITDNSSVNVNTDKFLAIVTRSEQSLGADRVLAILSTGLNIPLQTLQSEFAAGNLPLSNFFLAQVIANLAGMPINDVINLLNQQTHFNRIARQLGIPQNALSPSLQSFSQTLRNEIAINNGHGQGDTEQELSRLTKAQQALNNNFHQVSTRLGAAVFTNLLNQQLALQTGLTATEVANLRAGLPGNISDSQFAAALLTAISITTITPNGSINNIDLNTLLTSADIQTALTTNNIPFDIFTRRLNLLSSNVMIAAKPLGTVITENLGKE